MNLTANPTQLFIEVGETKEVIIGAVDNQGNPLDFNYEVTETGNGITVRRDSTFLPIFVNDSTLQAPATGPRFRFIVGGTDYTSTSFTVSAGGEEITIPVQVIPEAGLAATFDDDTVDLGQVVTLTAPAGVTFADTAFLTLGTDSAALANPLTILSQDATTITFIPPPSINSPVTVNGVISASTPNLVYAPATQTPLVTPLIDTVDVTYSTTTPALGQAVTMTVPNPLINLVVDSIIFPGQLPGREGDPQNIVVAADSSSLTFDAPPNIAGEATVVNFHFPGGYLRALPTRPVVTGENIGLSVPVGISNNTPAVSEAVTLTAPAGFSFDTSLDTTFAADGVTITSITSPLQVLLGGNPTVITSLAADGSTLSFVPLPGAAGIPQIDGVVPDAAPDNILTMPAEGDVTVPSEVPTLPGTDAPGTAPALDVPGVGELTVTFDTPDFEATVDHFYEVTLAAGTYDFTVDWNVGGDIDAVLCSGTCADPFGADVVGATDAANATAPGVGAYQGASAAHPEHITLTVPAGTYRLLVEDFGEDAAGATVTITIGRSE